MRPAPASIDVRPLRVLHILGSAQAGGTEVNVHDLVTRASPGIHHRVLFLSAEGPVGEALASAGVPTAYVARRGVAGVVKAAGAIARLARRDGCDLVVLYGLRANTLGRVAARCCGGAPTVGALHSLFPSGRKARWTLWLDRLTFGWTTGYISNSQAAADHLVSHGYPRDKFWVVRQGVDVARFAPAAESERAAIRSSLGVPGGCAVLACVANLRAVKDHATLLRALAIVKERGVPFRAFLAGEGPLRSQLEAQAASLGLAREVSFLGRLGREEVVRLLQTSDVALLSSRVEGLPTALLEAMACGCAVVATDVGGTGELVEPDVTGRLVRPADPRGMAAALADLLTQPDRLAGMRQAARHRVEERFSLERSVAATEELLARLAASRRGRARRSRGLCAPRGPGT